MPIFQVKALEVRATTKFPVQLVIQILLNQLTINIYLIIMKMILNRVVSHHFSQLEKMSYNLKKNTVY